MTYRSTRIKKVSAGRQRMLMMESCEDWIGTHEMGFSAAMAAKLVSQSA